MTTSAASPATVSMRPRRDSMAALRHQHTGICPESKGCQPALLHGRFCVQHCPCATCQQLRATVAQRLPRHSIGEVRS